MLVQTGKPRDPAASGAHFTVGQVVSYAALGALLLPLAANYAWLLVYARRHYARSEWGQSLARLDSFDTDDEEAAYKEEQSEYTRSRLDEESVPGDDLVTPFVLPAAPPARQRTGKGYDAPPDWPCPYDSYLTATYAGPSSAGPSLRAGTGTGTSGWDAEPPQSKWRRDEDPSPPCCSRCGYAAEKAALLRLDKWAQGDGYRREKRLIVDGEFGLHRTRSL